MGVIGNFVHRAFSGQDPTLSAVLVLLAAASTYIVIKESQTLPTSSAKKVLPNGKPTSLPSTLRNKDLDNTPFNEIEEILEAEEEGEFHDPFDLPQVPFAFTRVSHAESLKRSKEFYEMVNKRRSVRMFSSDPVPIEVVRNCCMAAATAPSGAHTE
ncbi:hypothetical protein HDU98_005201, partial [Podochytrium sp. JEL0797]